MIIYSFLNKKKTSPRNNTKNILGGSLFLNFCELEILMNKLIEQKNGIFCMKRNVNCTVPAGDSNEGIIIN